jgi:GxxExxY protein
VYDEDGTAIGDYNADLFVENRLIIELKACRALAEEHIAQLLGYLKSSKIEHGLLINFGSAKFQIKKYALSQDLHRSATDRLINVGLSFSAFFAFFCG